MIDYLFSSLPPGKGVDPVETGLSSIMANIALVVGTIILRPAIERHIHPAIWGHTPTSPDKRQFLKSVLGRRDLLSPVLDGLSTLRLRVKPTKAAIATAVTVVKAAPTPVQIYQEQSSFSAIMCIIACMVLALAGTVLSYQHFRQDASWSSPSPASSDNSDSSLEPNSRDSTPPNEDSSDEDSGSGGHPPPVPVFDLFYDFPILHLDKAVDTGDERVRDEDGPPPPPPPSFPTPVEDGDAFPRKPFISKWLSLTLVLSIISLVIERFFKRHGKTQNEASTPVPTVSERITVNEISGDVATLFPSAIPNPVINTNPTCPNQLPLVEIEPKPESLSVVATLFPSATPNPVINTNPTCPNRLPLVEIEPKPESLSVSTLVTSTVSQRSRKFMSALFSLIFISCLFGLAFIARYFLDYHLQRTTNTFFPMAIIRRRSLDEITASVPITTSSASSLPLVPTFAPATDDTAGSDELKFTTVHDEKTDDFLEVFRGLSISSSSDEVPVSNEKPTTSTTSMFGLPNTGERCTANGKGIKFLSEHVPKSNIPILAKKVQPISVALARSHALPICGAGQSSSTSLHYRHSPPSPVRPGLSASIHAPSPQNASIHSSISPSPSKDVTSTYAPSGDEPTEPIPIPVIDLSPDRRVRREIDPKRECYLVVLVDCGSVSSLSP